MSIEEKLKAGILAAKAGRMTEASNILIEVVKSDPQSELGWLWLGLCRTTPEQRDFCFQKVLTINPQNAEARHQLNLVHDAAQATPGIRPLNISSQTSKSSSRSVPASPTSKPPIHTNTTPGKPAPKNLRSTRSKNNKTILLWLGAAFVTLVCFSFVGIFALTNLNTIPAAPILPSPTLVAATPTPAYVPLFESTPCDFTKPDQAQVDCGFVIVPEERNGNLSDTIKIAVAIYHGANTSTKQDPIVYLSGGPGGEAINWSTSVYSSVIAPLLQDRDFVIFDPRGVGRSEPTLDCDEFGKTYLQDLEGNIPSDQRVSYYEGALLGCKNNLEKQGVNLSAYTSIDMATDTKDVIHALGYQKAVLYGVSYGTRVAQFVMRQHPEVVRSAILDSVVPVELQLFNQNSIRREDNLRVLFDDCKADLDCSTAYPELESAYEQAFEQLNAQPINATVTVSEDQTIEQSINGYTFHNTLLWALRTPQTISLAPQLIYRVRDGDSSTLLLSMSLPLLAFDSISMGSYISVNCHDQVFAMSFENLDATISNLCKLWNIKPPFPGENDPIQSEIPTLIFAGRYDTTTPPSFAHQLADHLGKSYVVEIPNQGHAPSATGLSECPTQLISDFLQDPNNSPDLTCVKETSAIKFVVPFNINMPITLEPATIEQFQIHTSIPAGWVKAGYGFYNRNGYWGDITQIGIQRTPVSEEQWIQWLATNFQGTNGLDETPVLSEKHKANGMDWSIYRTSSRGIPVTIAFTTSHEQTLMVLLICHKDEQEALYNRVFLPIIESAIYK